jgi:hypothetical protein
LRESLFTTYKIAPKKSLCQRKFGGNFVQVNIGKVQLLTPQKGDFEQLENKMYKKYYFVSEIF